MSDEQLYIQSVNLVIMFPMWSIKNFHCQRSTVKYWYCRLCIKSVIYSSKTQELPGLSGRVGMLSPWHIPWQGHKSMSDTRSQSLDMKCTITDVWISK